MTYYPIVQNNDRPDAAPGNRPLPAFYMGDFCVVGFRVNDCDQAVRILDRHAFPLKRAGGSLEVDIEGAAAMHDVVSLLNANGLECEMADLAGGMYQG